MPTLTVSRFVQTAMAASLCLATASASAAPSVSDSKIAGVSIPQTALARSARAFIARIEPNFLFNHSLRTYIFGAMVMRARGLPFDSETAYIAALFHDLGLVARRASPHGSFEVDSANEAEAFILKGGGRADQARVVWNAIAMHDLGRSYQSHQSHEALLVGVGASTDVDGPSDPIFSKPVVELVLRAVPRLQFKKQFMATAVEHCRRKPLSQIGWLDPLCRKVAPAADHGSVEAEVMSATFTE